MNEEKEINALNNDVNTNNVEILEDMLKSSQHKPEQNIEINVEGNLMQNQDINGLASWFKELSEKEMERISNFINYPSESKGEER